MGQQVLVSIDADLVPALVSLLSERAQALMVEGARYRTLRASKKTGSQALEAGRLPVTRITIERPDDDR